MKAALTPVVVVAALLALSGCGGSGNSLPTRPTIVGPVTQDANGVWIFRPAGKPKRVVIFFHGQAGKTETTPANHRPWIDHLVRRGAVVVYPRYETGYASSVMKAADAGIKTAGDEVDLEGLPVVSMGYSRGGALAVEYAAGAAGRHLPVPDAVESVNPVPIGEQGHIVDLTPLRHSTVMALIVSDKDPATGSSRLLLRRLELADFPAGQIRLNVARSHGKFVADHLAPLGTSAAARRAYWAPTDALLASLRRSRNS